jgi:hypothetical protein
LRQKLVRAQIKLPNSPDHDQEPYDWDDDGWFYEEAVYGEEYYIEREQELIRQRPEGFLLKIYRVFPGPAG